ncbi:unnamed protein product, partial [Polarella glacialis]
MAAKVDALQRQRAGLDVPSKERPCWLATADSWVLALPAPEGLASAADVILDAGDEVLRVQFPGGSEALTMPWPTGVGSAEAASCSARFSRRRGELLLTVPAAKVPEEAAASGAAAATASAAASAAAATAAPATTAAPAAAAAPATTTTTPTRTKTIPTAPPPPTTTAAAANAAATAAVSREVEVAVVAATTTAAVSREADAKSSAGEVITPQEIDRRVDWLKSALPAKADLERDCGRSESKNSAAPRSLGPSSPAADQDRALDLAAVLMLHSAAATGNAEFALRLLQAKADANMQDELGATALEKACIAGNLEIVEAMLKFGAKAEGMAGAPSTPLHRVAVTGDSAKSRELVVALLET